MSHARIIRRDWVVFALLSVLLAPRLAGAQGVYAPGVGAINRSMGSAAVAAPLDGMGALNWNPATISGLSNSELAFSLEALIPNIDTYSSVPGVGAGVTTSESGATPLPNVAWVHKTPDPRLTIGFGIMSVAGFMTNFPSDPSNPILAPQRTPGSFPLGGFGRIYTEAAFIDLAPTVSYALTERLAFGVAPIATMAKLEVEPMVFSGLDNANGDIVSTYPRGQGSRYTWGGGANLGLFYLVNDSWRFGASVKTPRWMEEFRFHTEDEIGNPLVGRFDVELPMVVSVGTSFGSTNSGLVAVDVRYVDYENAAGFGDRGLDATTGRLNGLGWKSILTVASGVQMRLSDTLLGRLGYVYNQNPIRDSLTQYNVGAPLHYEHTISGGLSYQPVCHISINLSYAYSFESEISGPITLPPNAPTATPPTVVPGSLVSSTLSSHAVDLGVTVKY